MSAIARGVAQRVVFGAFSSVTGDVLTGLTITATVSKDGGAFAAVSDAPVEIGSTAAYELTLTNTEMDADVVTLKLTGTNMLTKYITIYTDTIADDIAALPTAAENADAVWDEDITTHMVANSTAATLQDISDVTSGIEFYTRNLYERVLYSLEVAIDNAGSEDSWVFNPGPSIVGAPVNLWVYDETGADLIGTTGSPQAMTAVAADRVYRYAASGAERMTAGRVYVARITSADIDGNNPTLYYVVPVPSLLVVDVGNIQNDKITAASIAANAIDDAALAADLDTYQADIRVFKDSTTDYYEVVYKKNSHPITSGVTVPTIQVIKASDGSDLVASTALTQIAATGYYKYDEGTNRIDFGDRYIVVVTATIDGSTRAMAVGVGRDG